MVGPGGLIRGCVLVLREGLSRIIFVSNRFLVFVFAGPTIDCTKLFSSKIGRLNVCYLYGRLSRALQEDEMIDHHLRKDHDGRGRLYASNIFP